MAANVFVAQPDSARVSEVRGCGFESRRGHHFFHPGSAADESVCLRSRRSRVQFPPGVPLLPVWRNWTAREDPTLEVAGSSPVAGANFIRSVAQFGRARASGARGRKVRILPLRPTSLEGWPSGQKQRLAKAPAAQAVRGFESHLFRQFSMVTVAKRPRHPVVIRVTGGSSPPSHPTPPFLSGRSSAW